jgi:membrane protease YdiL (CAAX protease family)
VIAQRQPVGLGRALFAALLVFLLSQLTLAPFGEVDDFHPQVSLTVAIVIGLFTFFGNGLAMRTCFEVAFANRRRQWPIFGIACPPGERALIGTVTFPFIGAVALIVGGIITTVLGLNHGTTNIPTVHKSDGFGLLVAVVAIGVAPWAEEIAFRGFLFGGLQRRMHPVLAAFLAGGAWASIHLVWAVLIPFTLLGMALCWLRWYTGSILPGVGLHATYNALISAFGGAALDPYWSVVALVPTLVAVVVTALWARPR